MLLVDNLQSALNELSANKFRSFLTTLGIIIAVTAVIAVVSILEGMSGYVTGFIQGLGSDAMWVAPKDPETGEAGGKAKLTLEDIQAVERECPDLLRAVPMFQVRLSVTYEGKQTSTPLIGTTWNFQEIRNWFVDAGRFFSDQETRRRAEVCVMGRTIAEELGLGENVVRREVRIKGRSFRVVGLLEEKGSLFGQDQDQMVLIPLPTAEKVFGSQITDALSMLAQTTSEEDTPEAVQQVKELLRRRHELAPGDPDDFQISTQDQILEFFTSASRMATTVLIGIVGISLLVGGIGIMNIMLVSVTERTREIGILKALGAKPRDILLQFLVEAILLSLIGGFVGVLLGIGMGLLVGAFSPLPAALAPPWAIFLSFAFSAVVGVFFGMYPAVKAARLNPITALRWE